MLTQLFEPRKPRTDRVTSSRREAAGPHAPGPLQMLTADSHLTTSPEDHAGSCTASPEDGDSDGAPHGRGAAHPPPSKKQKAQKAVPRELAGLQEQHFGQDTSRATGGTRSWRN